MLLSNTEQTYIAGTSTNVGAYTHAQGFNTGSNAPGYSLDSIELHVDRVPASPSDVTVELWSANSDSKPNASVAALTHSTGTWATDANTFNAPTDTELDASTLYFVHVSYGGTGSQLALDVTESSAHDSGVAAGWSVGRRYERTDGSWSSGSRRLRFKIIGAETIAETMLINQPSEIRAYWRDDPDNPNGSNEQVDCASTERFRAYWNPPKSNGSFKSADEWEAEITPDPEYGASNVSFTIQDTGGNRREPELTGTVDIDGFSTVSIRVRGRFGNAWGAWSPRTGLYCWSSSSEARALVTMLAAEGARSVTEGTEVKFTLTRELPTTTEVMVKVSVTERGEVIQAGSYQPPEEVTFTAGDTTATLTVLTEDDDQQESDGAVIATLQPGPDYRLGQSSTRTAQVTVEDDEGGAPPGPIGPGGPPGPVDTARPPSAPRNLQAVGGDEQVTLSWEAPEEEGGFAITDYEYLISGAGLGWISTESTDLTHTVTGLVNGRIYLFQVRAVSAAGAGSSTNRVEVTPGVGRLEFAHFANGSSITSDLVLINVFARPIRPWLYFYDREGERIAAESVVEVTEELEVAEDGSLTVQTEMQPLAGTDDFHPWSRGGGGGIGDGPLQRSYWRGAAL